MGKATDNSKLSEQLTGLSEQIEALRDQPREAKSLPPLWVPSFTLVTNNKRVEEQREEDLVFRPVDYMCGAGAVRRRLGRKWC